MYILIHGKSGSGKSNLSDLIRNAIFKADRDSKIITDDEDRQIKDWGKGSNEYTVNVMRTLEKEDEEKADIIVNIKNNKFREWHQRFID